MAKRANPFLEDFIPQSKVHFGLKQFNNNEERLKQVYAKTLELLFKGAKKLPAQDVSNKPELHSNNKKDNMKQLFIGKNGSLQHSGALVADKCGFSQQCLCGKHQLEHSCAYCEMQLCACSQHVCALCEHTHCSKCSLTGSEGAEVCVSCYQ